MDFTNDELSDVLSRAEALHSISGHPSLDDSAKEAIRRWAFKQSNVIRRSAERNAWTRNDLAAGLANLMEKAHERDRTANVISGSHMQVALDGCDTCG